MNNLKILIYKIYGRLLPLITNMKWEFLSRRKNYSGINREEKRERELILSLTSFPGRITSVHQTIKSLMLQSVKPDRIILWLAPEEFDNGIIELPESLSSLQKYGLSIKQCKNMRSYNKLIPTLKEYPDAVIITVDDDIYYYGSLIKRLYEAYQKDSSYVYAHRITKMVFQKDGFEAVAGGVDCYPVPTFLHKLTGVGGVIYPPHIFYQDVLKEKIFTRLAPTNDDIWFWLMLVLNGVKVSIPSKNNPILSYVGHTQENQCLNKQNDYGENLFWKDFYRMLEYYPQLKNILKVEWENMKER